MEDDGVSAGAPTRAPPPPPPRRDTAARTEPGTAHSNHGARRSRRTAHRPSGRRARSDRKLAHLCRRAHPPPGGGGGRQSQRQRPRWRQGGDVWTALAGACSRPCAMLAKGVRGVKLPSRASRAAHATTPARSQAATQSHAQGLNTCASAAPPRRRATCRMAVAQAKCRKACEHALYSLTRALGQASIGRRRPRTGTHMVSSSRARLTGRRTPPGWCAILLWLHASIALPDAMSLPFPRGGCSTS